MSGDILAPPLADAAVEHVIALMRTTRMPHAPAVVADVLATATVDRLLHHAHLCQTSGECPAHASPKRQRNPPMNWTKTRSGAPATRHAQAPTLSKNTCRQRSRSSCRRRLRAALYSSKSSLDLKHDFSLSKSYLTLIPEPLIG